MPFHISKPSALNPSVNVYYAGPKRWTDDYSAREVFSTESAANNIRNATSTVITGTRSGAGFIGASVVSE